MNFQPGLPADVVYDLTVHHIHNLYLYLYLYWFKKPIGFKWNTWASLATWLRLTITYINPDHAKPNQT